MRLHSDRGPNEAQLHTGVAGPPDGGSSRSADVRGSSALCRVTNSLITVVLTLLLAASAAYSTVNWASGYCSMTWSDMRIGSMLDGTARKPFVNRSLVPALFKTAADVGQAAVEPLHQLLVEFDQTHRIVRGFHRSHGMDSEEAGTLYLAMVWLSLLLLGVGVVRFLRALGHTSKGPWVVAIVTILLWPLLKCDERNMYFMYDPFTPTFVLWTLYAFFRRYFWAAFVGFLVCLLNRETAVLLPGVAAYALMPGHGFKEKLSRLSQDLRACKFQPWLGLVVGTASGVGLVFFARWFLLNRVFSDALGQAVEMHLFNTTLELHHALRYLPTMVLVGSVFYLLTFRRWSRLNGVLQGATLMFALQLAMGAIVGVIDEVRQYSELYGIGAVLAGTAVLNPRPVLPEFAPPRRTTCSWIVNLMALAFLVVVTLSSVSHWRDATTADLERVDLNERKALFRQGRPGQKWDARGNYIFRVQRPTIFVLKPLRTADYINIGLDGNDEYRVTVKTDHEEKRYRLPSPRKNGIRDHELEAPPGRVEEVWIHPIRGDGKYSVGYIRLR